MRVSLSGCLGPCSRGPLVRVETDETDALFADLTADVAEQLVDAYGSDPSMNPDEHRLAQDSPFFAKQVRIVTANAGRVDPEVIDDYLAAGGYGALEKAVTSLTPQQVVAEVSRSGLRGRGGAGFPTGVKWGLVARVEADQKYVICNGDEGDPGAYMDESVMEGDPHRVLEGMAIAGYAVGANQGFIYVRGEYPVAIRRLERAIRQAERQGVLGRAHLRHTVPVPDRHSRRRRRLRVRRRDRAHRVHRRRPGRPSSTATLSCRVRTVGQADAHQQCRDVRQRRANRGAWR